MFNGAVDMAQLMQASCLAAGIKVDIKKEPADGFWDNVWLKGAYRRELLGRTRGGDADAVGRLRRQSAVERDALEQREVREVARGRAQAKIDEAKRKPYIWEMQKMLHDDGGAIIPVFRDWLDAHHDEGRRPHADRRVRHGQRL